MASPHPQPDNERERFPLPWEDDDAPGLSVHALTKEDMEAILASMHDEPDAPPPPPPPPPPCGCPPCNAPPPPGVGSGGRLAPRRLRPVRVPAPPPGRACR